MLAMINVVCLRPGVGGRRSGTPGTELERYFGWPATVVAEQWESDDPDLASKILRVAPVYRPHEEMKLSVRRVSVIAAILNVVFAVGIEVALRSLFPPYEATRSEAGIVAIVICALIVRFGRHFGTYL
ncbi:MAG TPA: hypothetical protein VGI81_00210 [Tepidisphaeraceae bacterium]